MEAEYGEVGEGVFEGDGSRVSSQVFSERLGQVEADAESEAVEQVESERVSVFAPVNWSLRRLQRLQHNRNRNDWLSVSVRWRRNMVKLVKAYLKETEAESAVEVFGERLGQVEADAESEAVEQVESERVSVFAPVELESEALAETAAQPEQERLVERVGEMEAEYGEVGEGVFEGDGSRVGSRSVQ
ncbi:Ankyrin-2 [Schistosoma haematobium]|uniref:Ankyrin-2 n=1 Tax=Schistosoma haematobium TaxID=6185 RepID=A0A922S266_SCHHA|nr:Ankyrin-2 [Schistosoma haematobium]KAH9590539.1 Ankyrin-2 [Schistosoma haematobium]